MFQARVQTHHSCPKLSEGEASTSHGKDNRSLAIFSLGNSRPSLGIQNKVLETFALWKHLLCVFLFFLLLCVLDGAVCLMSYIEATRFPIQRRQKKRSLPDHRPSESRRTDFGWIVDE